MSTVTFMLQYMYTDEQGSKIKIINTRSGISEQNNLLLKQLIAPFASLSTTSLPSSGFTLAGHAAIYQDRFPV